MKQFKVGDRVRVIARNIGSNNKVGDIGTIETVANNGKSCKYQIRPDGFSGTLISRWENDDTIEPLQSESYQITKDRILAAASKCPDAKATLEVLFPDAFEKKPITWNSMKWYCPKHTAITERRTDNIVLDWSVDGKFSLNTNRFDYKINNDELVITPK